MLQKYRNLSTSLIALHFFVNAADVIDLIKRRVLGTNAAEMRHREVVASNDRPRTERTPSE